MSNPQEQDDIIQAIERLIEGFSSGEITSATLRVMDKDGSEQTYQLGYTSEEEKDAAMAKLLKILGELH